MFFFFIETLEVKEHKCYIYVKKWYKLLFYNQMTMSDYFQPVLGASY